MNIKLETFIAIRYFRSRRDQSFISISSLFSFLGITIGVATLIIVMSVMNGFRTQLIDKIVGINGHLVLYFNDESYKKFNIDIPDTKYMEMQLFGQLDNRKKEFQKITL